MNPDRLFPTDPSVRAVTRELYQEVKDLPMISEISGSEAARVEKAAMDLFDQEEKNSEF